MLTTWSWLWLLATILFVIGGTLNLSQRATKDSPATDGVSWVQKQDGIYAENVAANLSAARAGILPGDKLIGISLDEKNFEEIALPSDVQLYLETAGIGGSVTYFYQRPSYRFKDNFYYADLHKLDTLPRWSASIVFLSIVGLIWLAIGTFVLFKQGSNAPFVLHFAVLSLAAFVFQTYRPIGTGEDLDLAITILDDLAFAFFPAIFLHFCWRYPTQTAVFVPRKGWKTLLVYLPAAIIWSILCFSYISFRAEFMSEWARTIDKFDLIENLNFVSFCHFFAGITLGSGILIRRFIFNKQPIIRQRLKWAIWGTIGAVIPATSFYFAKQVFGFPESGLMSAFATLPLALIPIGFGHSVVRYRLMDVDVVVRRVFVYALTTIAIAMIIGTIAFAVIFLAVGGDTAILTANMPRIIIAGIAMAAIVLLSEPLKNFLQERADRFFYGERYDLRRGLLDFGRTLSANTALDPLLNALVSRLQQVLNVEKVAVFIEDENSLGGYNLARAVGIANGFDIPGDFRQMIREKSAKTGIVRVDDLVDINETEGGFQRELHYFVPCVVRGRMVAVIGLGRTVDGSLLSSEDIEILRTVAGYVGVAIENSLLYQEQEKRTTELELLKEFNESIVESVNVGLLAVDENGCLTHCNSTLEDLLEIKRETSVGKKVESLFDSKFGESLAKLLGKSSWHLKELRNAYKLYAETATGKRLVLNVAIAPLRSQLNARKGAIVVLEDVSSRHKLEEQLQQSEKLSSIGLLAAGVAHEVNTPLTGVSSYTQVLLGMFSEDDPKHALLQKVQRQTERATNIVGNLLNFSRAGNLTEFSQIDVNKTLDDTLQLLEPQLRKGNVEIVKAYDPNPPAIYGNSGKLQQVFTNLVINARDAINGHGGRIELKTKTMSDGVLIEISDSGEGISPENLSKIYDPFFTTKGVGRGTGLGLAVSYGIVQEHQGQIEVESKIGQGTTFRLTFPIVEPKRFKKASGE